MTSLLFLIGAALMIWLLVRTVRNNPHAFSRENLSKSFSTIGILTLIVILVIFVCVMFLRNS